MPLKEFKCSPCGTVFDSLIRNEQDRAETQCPACGESTELVENTIVAHGTYFINGDNSASRRPRKSRSTEG